MAEQGPPHVPDARPRLRLVAPAGEAPGPALWDEQDRRNSEGRPHGLPTGYRFAIPAAGLSSPAMTRGART